MVGLRCALPRLLFPGPIRSIDELSEGARALVAEAFRDVDPAAVWDVHAHVVGVGAGGTGCVLSPEMRSPWNVVERLKLDVNLAASGVDDLAAADSVYVERLLALQRAANPRGRVLLLAFEWHVDESGRTVPERSPFHTPNDYVLELARRHEVALPVVSIHPYRSDAVERLERCVEAGAVAVKWLPNSMGIDPAAPRCDPFYDVLAARGVPLITHAGYESAVHSGGAQHLGNPLRLRRPLDRGVRVVIAHCASAGVSQDLDAGSGGQGGRGGPEVESFDLFLRLMGESRHEGRLFGEISALTLFNRCGRPLREMLSAPELHPRLVNGSDYPLPAVDPLISTRLLVHRGYLPAEERPLLEEIFEANPLLFDYVLKRRIAVDTPSGRQGFLPTVFESRRLFA